MNKLTRKELKTDHFVEEVEHGVEYLSEHKRQFVRLGSLAGAVLIIAVGSYFFFQTRKAARQELLNKAFAIKEAPVGPPQANFTPPYATLSSRDMAANKAFAEVAAVYPSSEEAMTAKYFMGTYAANEAKWPEAGKLLKEASSGGNTETSALAKYALAQVYAAENKSPDAEKVLRELIDHPSMLVSKEQAQLTLGRMLLKSNPAEGRKLLESLRTASSAVSRAAVSALGEAN